MLTFATRLAVISPFRLVPRPNLTQQTLLMSAVQRRHQQTSPASSKEVVVGKEDSNINEEAEKDARDMQRSLSAAGKGSELSSVDDYRVDMEPFAKNLFLGKFDKKVLSYPDVVDNDRYYALEKRCQSLRTHLAGKADLVKKIDGDQKVSKDITLPLRTLGVYGLRGKLEMGGQGLCLTETLKVVEELSCNLSLSESVCGANTHGYMAIERCGTKSQKDRFLPGLLSGEKIGAVCVSDDQCGTDPSSTATVANYDEYDDVYHISGRKTWVTNGPTADVFTVFANAKVKDPSGVPRPQVTAFIVERNMPGISLGQREQKVGMKGLETCEIVFDKTPVPGANVLGHPGRGMDVFNEMASIDRVFAGAKVSSLLRELLNCTLKHVAGRKAFDKSLCEFDLVKHRLTKCANVIYTLESMTYMTAGLADVQREVDVNVEAAMTKLYASKAAKIVTDNCLSLLGGKAYLETEPYNQVARDLQAMELWEGSSDLLHMTVALSGVAHAGEAMAEEVKQLRNYMSYPYRVLKKRLEHSNQRHDWFFSLNHPLKLANFTHPSLQNAAHMLDYSVQKLKFAVEMVFIRHGQDVALKEVDLLRLSLVATEIYAITSAVARANRSYCQGHMHGEHELDLALAAAYEGGQLVKSQVKMVDEGFYCNSDFFTRRTAEYMLEFGGYSAEHPVTRNIF